MVETKKHEWLGDIIQDGFYDKLVIIGFPYDEAANGKVRQGCDLGPGKYHLIILECQIHSGGSLRTSLSRTQSTRLTFRKDSR